MIRSIGVPRAGLPRHTGAPPADPAGAGPRRGALHRERDEPSRRTGCWPTTRTCSATNAANGTERPPGADRQRRTAHLARPHRPAHRGQPGRLHAHAVEPAAGARASTSAVDTINATYATGAHVQTQSGQTGATRGAFALTFGIGVTPGVLHVVKVGGSISGTTNQSNRSQHAHRRRRRRPRRGQPDRGDAWSRTRRTGRSSSVRTRTRSWAANTRSTGSPDRARRSLLLWIPEHYLDTPAAGPGHRDRRRRSGTTKLPPFFFASGLTNIPRLFDEIVETLRGAGTRPADRQPDPRRSCCRSCGT